MLNKNLSALAKRYPEYVDLIKNTPDTGRYKVVKSGDNYNNMYDSKLQVYIYNNLSPKIHSENDINSRNIKLGNVGLFLGSGFFYTISSYIQKFKNVSIFVVEPDIEFLKVAMCYTDVTELLLSNEFHLCLGDNVHTRLYNFINSGSNKIYVKAINIIDNSLSFQQYKDFYLDVMRILKEAAVNVIYRYGNDPDDSLIGIKNTFYNINTILNSPGIKDLKGAFKNKPGIVVAAGPSLNKNIHLLEGLYDKAVIVGADTVLPVLQKHGFKPHMVTSLERISLVAKLYEGQTEESLKDIYLAACPVIPPEVYDIYKGEKIIVYRNFATFEWIDIDKGTVDIGPSAGNMAYEVLEYLGCSPIILIGQDLAYAGTGDKISHVEGTVLGNTQQSQHEVFEIEGSIEPKVKTMQVWKLFKDMYEVSIARTNANVIDATEGGAKINGTTIMPFQEAIDKYVQKSFEPLSIIKKKLNKPFESIKNTQRKNLIKKVNSAIELSEKLIKSFNDSILSFNTFYDNFNNNMTDESFYPEAERVMEKIKQTQDMLGTKEFFLIFMHYVQSYYISSMISINEVRANENNPDDRMQVLTRYAHMFETLAKLIYVMQQELRVLLSELNKS